MKRTLLALTLLLLPFTASADEVCDANLQLIEWAMDLRVEGNSIVAAKQWAVDMYDGDMAQSSYDRWTSIVTMVYDVDAQFLTGVERSDLLTDVYRACVDGTPA